MMMKGCSSILADFKPVDCIGPSLVTSGLHHSISAAIESKEWGLPGRPLLPRAKAMPAGPATGFRRAILRQVNQIGKRVQARAVASRL